MKSLYRLVALPGGAKMKPADHGNAIANSPLLIDGAVRLDMPMSMRQLAERLGSFTGRPVEDATNLDGYFSVKLTFALDDAPADSRGGLHPLLPEALQEELGLKLVAATGAVQILVIDHADEAPTEN